MTNRKFALRGLIYSKFNSEAEFARELGWTRQHLSKITSGKKEPNLYEVQQIAEALRVAFSTVADIFLN